MADKARRRRARRARLKAAAAEAASAAGRPRYPAGAVPAAVAAGRAVVAASPQRAAATDALAAGRLGRCAAGDWPLALMLFVAADRVARPTVDPDAEPASPSGVSTAAGSWACRAAAAAVARPAAVAGPVREPADGRDHRRRAVDWLNSPPSPSRHARKSPRKRRVSQQSGSEKANRRPSATVRMLADFHRAAHGFSPAFCAARSLIESKYGETVEMLHDSCCAAEDQRSIGAAKAE